MAKVDKGFESQFHLFTQNVCKFSAWKEWWWDIVALGTFLDNYITVLLEYFGLIVGDDPVDQAVPSVPPNPVESLGARIRDLDVDSIRRYLAQKLGFYEPPETTSAPVEQVLDEVNLDGIVKWIKSERCKNIITLAGAGISTCKCKNINLISYLSNMFNANQVCCLWLSLLLFTILSMSVLLIICISMFLG